MASSEDMSRPSAEPATVAAPQPKSSCPPHVLEAIYGKPGNKKAQYEASLKNWWYTYAERRNDEEEYVADT